MPQENYILEGFSWDKSLEKLRHSSVVVGDLTDEMIAYTRGVACASIRVKNEYVAFNLSQYGKLQISHPNAELLRRAKSQLSKLCTCSRWVPTASSSPQPMKIYQSITELPEASDADWGQIPREEIIKLNKMFQIATRYHLDFLLDIVRSILKSYAKNSD